MVIERAKYVALLVCMLSAAGRVEAHRLDEYLQQTMLELHPDRVLVHVSLTPGVDVAAAVMASIDRNHDNVLSHTEQSAYAETVLRGLSLSIDETKLPLRVVQMSFPTADALTHGVAAIGLQLEAAPLEGLHSGILHFENHHEAASSVYLVNALLPRASSPIHVGAQTRDRNQSTYQALLTIGTAPSTAGGLGRSTLARVLLIAWTSAVVLWGARGLRRKSHAAS
jgi:hypothetical protein